MNPRIISVIGVLCALLLWEVASMLVANPRTFPGAFRSGHFAIEILSDGFGWDLFITSVRALSAWALGLLVAFPFGLLLGSFPSVHAAFRPVTAFLRAMPAFLLIVIPVALGLGGEFSRVGISAIAVALIIVDQCADGVGRVNVARSEALYSLGAGRWLRLHHHLFWEIFGNVVAPAARSTLGIAFIVVIVNESLVIPDHGVGARILNYLGSSDLGSVFGFLLLVGAVGVLLNELIVILMRFVVFWRE